MWGSDCGFDKVPEVEVCAWMKGKDWTSNFFTDVPLILTDMFRKYRGLSKLGVSFDSLCSMLMAAQIKQIYICCLLGWRVFR